MRTRLLFFSIILLEAFTGLTSCSKEDNSPDVYYSDWFSPTAWSGVSDNYYFYADAPAVTKDIIDKGTVLAYCILVNDDAVARPLPAYTTDYSVYGTMTYQISGK